MLSRAKYPKIGPVIIAVVGIYMVNVATLKQLADKRLRNEPMDKERPAPNAPRGAITEPNLYIRTRTLAELLNS